MEFLIFINNFRLINVPMLSKELGNPIEDAKSIKHKIKGGDLYFRELLKESFSLLPEDASRYEDIQETFNYSDRAKITYSKMTDDEKLELLNKKIEMITERIDRDSKISGNSKDNLYIQLRDHLDAAKLAYLEKKNIKNNEN